MPQQFQQIAAGVDVLPLQLELFRQPDLWDRNPTRRLYGNTPHGAMTDIWVRFRLAEEIASLESHREEYRCVWWPAWHALPALRPLVFSLMARVAATELGSVLITRLPPGAQILPHADTDGWAPNYYNTKAHITVAGSSLSTCGAQAITMMQGDIWTFDNLQLHSIENRGDVDRICVIVSMRCE